LATDDEWSTWCEKYKLEWEELEKTELENLNKETRGLYYQIEGDCEKNHNLI
tara:strand:- start:204 stop:359 length:156 start_codon:yes stop_codon:yes gene_type:complete